MISARFAKKSTIAAAVKASTVAITLVVLSACSSVPRIVSEYKIDVQQGNVLTQEMVAQLRPGLTKDQVRFVLGTPMLTDMFHADRWDYVYRLRDGASGDVDMRKFAVFFDEQGKLTRVAGDVAAAQSTDAVVADTRPREIDLGSIDGDTKAPPMEQRGFFGRMWDGMGF